MEYEFSRKGEGIGSRGFVARSRCPDVPDEQYRDRIREAFSELDGKWVRMSFCFENGRSIRTIEGIAQRYCSIFDPVERRDYIKLDRLLTEGKRSEIKVGDLYIGFHHIMLDVLGSTRVLSEQEEAERYKRWLEREYAMRSADHFR